MAFAADYRLTPAPVVNELTIDSNTPSTGGVRVVELNSINFVDDLDEITPEHAQQIERVLVTMAAFPNVTVHVVGNTDAQGDEVGNLAVSQQRAEAVVGVPGEQRCRTGASDHAGRRSDRIRCAPTRLPRLTPSTVAPSSSSSACSTADASVFDLDQFRGPGRA